MTAPGGARPAGSLHTLGVVCGLAAGAWLGIAEAPTKLVTVGFSPFLISLGMVAGVFVARWTVPLALKGTGYVLLDLREKSHLIVWAIAGGNAVGGGEHAHRLRDSQRRALHRFSALEHEQPGGPVLGLAAVQRTARRGREAVAARARRRGRHCRGRLRARSAPLLTAPAAAPHSATLGILAALGAGLLWGTMYIPYRKAYISGMNPLSFVTVFTFGELGTVAGAGAGVRRRLAQVWPRS